MDKILNALANFSSLVVRIEEEAKEHFTFKELTLTQMHYLETIWQLKNPNITELAAAMNLTKPTVTVTVEKLIEKEIIVKVHSDEDRRNSHLHLTEKGRLINYMHDYAHRRLAEHLINKLNKEELENLIQLFDKATQG